MATVDEHARHELYNAIERVIGDAHADTLMSMLGPTGWAEVATKDSLRTLEAATKDALGAFEDRMNLRFRAFEDRMNLRFRAFEDRMNLRFGEFEERMNLRFGEFEQRMNLRFTGSEHAMELRFEAVDERFATLEHKMDASLQRGLREQARTFFIGMLTANATLASVAFAAARLV